MRFATSRHRQLDLRERICSLTYAMRAHPSTSAINNVISNRRAMRTGNDAFSRRRRRRRRHRRRRASRET